MKLANPLHRWRQRRTLQGLRRQVERIERYLEPIPSTPGQQPVLVFNASTRIHRLSLNGAFSLLTAWGLRAAGTPIRHLVCQRGLDLCVLGTRPERPSAPPPCQPCLEVSSALFPQRLAVSWVQDPYVVRETLSRLAASSLQELVTWEGEGLPLGQLCLPSLRWILRRHHLVETEATLHLYRRYLASALGLARQGELVLRQVRPTAVVVFNGLFYPESVLRSLARRMDIPVITHEVGLRPLSAYFSHQDATFRSLDLPANAVLSDAEDARLDRYLSDRLQGDFTMAGIRFWDGMEGLPGGLRERIAAHRQVVGVFGNVAFDTSQIHANTLFEDMFQWLDGVAEVIGRHPETLFVFRAHPDEGRPGKESQESLASWFRVRGLDRHRNAVLIPPHDPTSSYDIVHASKFVLVYSSSIGLEASILRVPVLCAGRARYTQVPAVLLPPDRDAYWRTLEMWLATQAVPFEESWRRVARAFLYQELFQASLDLGEFVAADPTMPGMVQFAPFKPEGLRHASVIEVIRRGIQEGAPFLALPQAPTMEPGRA